jgi:hypothetical protein
MAPGKKGKEEDWRVAAVVAAIILYALLIKWLFEHLFLDALVGAALVAVVVAPIAYGFGAYKTFRSAVDWRPRDWFWIPVVALLALIYADLVVLLTTAFEAFFDRPQAPSWLHPEDSFFLNGLAPFVNGYPVSLQWLLHPLVGIDPATQGNASPWVYACFALVGKIVLALVCLLAARGFESDYEDGDEPAHRQYFFADAYRDMRRLVAESWTGISIYYVRGGNATLALFTSADARFLWFLLIFVWPLAIALILGLVVFPGLLGALFLPLMFLIHALALALLGLLFVGVALLLWLIERAILFVRSGWAKCPHPGCYQSVALPVYRCPSCGARHKRLLPGRCGVLRRQCECGHYLPTFSWFGKQRLDAECPHCGGELPHALFSSNLILPIYGGPAAGKTMFKHAGVERLLEGHQPDLHAGLIVGRERLDYQARLKPAFDRGQLPPKTTDAKPPAYLLALRRLGGLARGGRPVSVYLYDPAGETNEQETHLDQQHYLRHLGGLALLIDPLSLPSMKTAFEATGQPLPAGTCRSDPLDIVERVHEALEKHTGLRATSRFQRRLAVVFTKGDIPFVQGELGVTVDGNPAHAAWDGFDRATSEQIHDWLHRNEPAFLHALKTHFKRVQFFIVSAMGHEARTQRPFQPKRVLEPLLWLLAARGALRRPVLTRWGMTAAEVAIVTLLLGAFLIVPIGGVSVAAAARKQAALVLCSECVPDSIFELPRVDAPDPPWPPRIAFQPETSPPADPTPPPTLTAPPAPRFKIVDDRIQAGPSPDGRQPPRAQARFSADDAPLTYYVSYRDGLAGDQLLVQWNRNGRFWDTGTVPLEGDGEGQVQSPSPLMPGDYEVIVTLDSKELRRHAFAVTAPVVAASGRQDPPASAAGDPLGYLPETPPVRFAQVAASKLNVRAEPGTDKRIVFSLPRGTEVQVKPGSTPAGAFTWVEIEVSQGNGWVAEKFLRYR